METETGVLAMKCCLLSCSLWLAQFTLCYKPGHHPQWALSFHINHQTTKWLAYRSIWWKQFLHERFLIQDYFSLCYLYKKSNYHSRKMLVLICFFYCYVFMSRNFCMYNKTWYCISWLGAEMFQVVFLGIAWCDEMCSAKGMLHVQN